MQNTDDVRCLRGERWRLTAVMQRGSVAEFFAMGGYGLYVWPSFGVAALCMGGEVIAVWRRHAAASESHDES